MRFRLTSNASDTAPASSKQQPLDSFHDKHVLRSTDWVLIDGASGQERLELLVCADMSQGAHPANAVQVLPELPRLKDLLNHCEEPGELVGELRVPICRPDEVDQLLADQIAERLLSPECFPDVACRFALLDPDLVEFDHACSS